MRFKEFINESWPIAFGAAAGALGAGTALKDRKFVAPPAVAPATPAPVAPAAPAAKTAQTRSISPKQVQAKEFDSLAVPPRATVLLQAAQRSGIKGKELAQFMAQMEHESWDFERMHEVPRGRNYFNRYDIKHSPRIARELGNVKPGDGYKYRGRGFIQLTGRTNYEMAGRYLGIDLVNQPDLASQPKIAAQIAVYYWMTRVRPNVSDYADTKNVTRYINPGLKGLQDREQNFINYMQQGDPNWQYVPKR